MQFNHMDPKAWEVNTITHTLISQVKLNPSSKFIPAKIILQGQEGGTHLIQTLIKLKIT